MRALKRKSIIRRISNILYVVVNIKWIYFYYVILILTQTTTGTLYAGDLTKYYPKVGSKVKSIKIHDTRTLNRASTHGLNWCDYDTKYPAVQIETAIRFHFFSVASMYKDVYEEEEEDHNGNEKEPDFEDVEFENKLKTLHGKGRLKRKQIKPRNDDIHKASKCKKLKSLCSTQGDEIIRPRRAKKYGWGMENHCERCNR